MTGPVAIMTCRVVDQWGNPILASALPIGVEIPVAKTSFQREIDPMTGQSVLVQIIEVVT